MGRAYNQVESKVLVYEVDPSQMDSLRVFFNGHDIIGLRAESSEGLLRILRENIDLGAIFLCEEPDYKGVTGLDLASQLHSIRAELPIFIRRDKKNDEAPMSPEMKRICTADYKTGDFVSLGELVNRHIFSRYYPNQVTQVIEESTIESLQEIIGGSRITCSSPYLIRDRVLYGQVASLMRLDSYWCRGYMILQAEEPDIYKLIAGSKTPLCAKDAGVDGINAILSELTNATWGKLKGRILDSGSKEVVEYKADIPVVISHSRSYLGLGCNEPLLAFKYEVDIPGDQFEVMTFYQAFAFHLLWKPERIEEKEATLKEFVDSGELFFL